MEKKTIVITLEFENGKLKSQRKDITITKDSSSSDKGAGFKFNDPCFNKND